MLYGATYSTDAENFGEILEIFPVEDDWQGFRFHGYCWPSQQDLDNFFQGETP